MDPDIGDNILKQTDSTTFAKTPWSQTCANTFRRYVLESDWLQDACGDVLELEYFQNVCEDVLQPDWLQTVCGPDWLQARRSAARLAPDLPNCMLRASMQISYDFLMHICRPGVAE